MENKIAMNRSKFIEIFFIMKIFADMLYQFKFIDIILLFLALSIVIYSIFRNDIYVCFSDLLVLALFLLFTISFIKDISYYFDYFKISSAFLLYFIGRLNYQNDSHVSHTLQRGFLLILYINTLICFTGFGTKVWGTAETFSGLYYFKTDFALMLSYFLIFWLFDENKNSWRKWIPSILCLLLIFLCNSRIFYLISILILYLNYLFSKKLKIITLGHLAFTVGVAIFSIIVISQLNNIPIFQNRHFIGLQYNSFSDLMDTSNTQGRNIIWYNLTTAFNQQSVITKLFGADLGFNDKYGLEGFNEHSLYIKLLINTGYIGLFIWLLFVLYIIRQISKYSISRYNYIEFSLLMVFSILGISVPTILFTDASWIPMFFLGCCISKYSERNKTCTTKFSFSTKDYFKCTTTN